MFKSLLKLSVAATMLTLLGFPGLVLAQESSSSNTNGVIKFDPAELNDEDTFDVGGSDGLLSTDNQDQAYLEDKENAPVVAFILDVINFFTRIIGAITMVLIIIGGLLMIVSEGDENRLQQGKGILEAAIIGLIIVMFSYIIVLFVQSIFYIQQ